MPRGAPVQYKIAALFQEAIPILAQRLLYCCPAYGVFPRKVVMRIKLSSFHSKHVLLACMSCMACVSLPAFAADQETQTEGDEGVVKPRWQRKVVHGDYNESAENDADNPADRFEPDNSRVNAPASAGNDESARAAAAMDAVQKKVEREFESSAEWTQASVELTRARNTYNQARVAVIRALLDQPPYRATLAASAKADQALKDLRASGSAAPGDLSAAAARSLNARSEVSKLETIACAADPALLAIEAKLKDATQAMAQLRRKERSAVLANSEWQAARQKFDDVKSRSTSAKK